MTNDSENEIIIEPIKNLIILNDDFIESIYKISETMSPIIDGLATSLKESVIPATRIISESMSEVVSTLKDYPFSAIENFAQQMRETIRNMKPLFDYIEENRDRIDNLYESLEKFRIKYSHLDDNTFDEMIGSLLDDGKIVINDDWTIETVEQNTVKRSKSISPENITNIIRVVGIAVQLFAASQTIEINIDNSTTNVENHYHTENHYYITETSNEYTVINDTKLYENASVYSDDITNLNVGDTIHKIVIENGWILSSILDENNEIKYSGWIKIDDVNIE